MPKGGCNDFARDIIGCFAAGGRSCHNVPVPGGDGGGDGGALSDEFEPFGGYALMNEGAGVEVRAEAAKKAETTLGKTFTIALHEISVETALRKVTFDKKEVFPVRVSSRTFFSMENPITYNWSNGRG